MLFVLDILGAILCIAGLILVGNKKWYGFIVTLVCAIVYFMIGILVGLIGLTILNCILVCVHARNLRKWYRERNMDADQMVLSLLRDKCRKDAGFRRKLLAYVQSEIEKGYTA